MVFSEAVVNCGRRGGSRDQSVRNKWRLVVLDEVGEIE